MPKKMLPGAQLSYQLNRIQKELDELRLQVVWDFAGDDLNGNVHRYLHSTNSKERHRAFDELIEDVVDQILVGKKYEEDFLGVKRAFCPFCRKGVKPYGLPQTGYVLPNGLRLHFEGNSRVRQCVVVKAAYDYSIDHSRPEFL